MQSLLKCFNVWIFTAYNISNNTVYTKEKVEGEEEESSKYARKPEGKLKSISGFYFFVE